MFVVAVSDEAVKLWERVAANSESANDAVLSLAQFYIELGLVEIFTCRVQLDGQPRPNEYSIGWEMKPE